MLEPFAVFEEVCSVVLVEIVPPLCGIGIESIFELLASAWNETEQNFVVEKYYSDRSERHC